MSSEFNPETVMKLSEEYCGLIVERERVAHAIRENEEAVKIQHGKAEELDKRIAAHRNTMASAFGIIRPSDMAVPSTIALTSVAGRSW